MTDTETEDPPERVYGEMITDARHLTKLPLGGAETIERYLSCPVCLEIMVAPTATECLHRFCAMCIETSLRLGKKECPSCRLPVATRRALRRDDNFESLVEQVPSQGNGLAESRSNHSALRRVRCCRPRPSAHVRGSYGFDIGVIAVEYDGVVRARFDKSNDFARW